MDDQALLSYPVLFTIFSLACVTFANRFFGYWMMKFIPLTGRVRAGLEALPAAILISLVAPMALSAGMIGFICIGVTILAVLSLKNAALSVAVGVGTVIVIRYLGALS